MSGDYICRVCEASDNLELLFKKENKNLIDMLKTILDVPVEPDDYLPQCLCASCIQRLNQAYKFKLKFLNTDFQLRNRLPTGAESVGFEQKDGSCIEDIPISDDPSELPTVKVDGSVEQITIKQETPFEPDEANAINEQETTAPVGTTEEVVTPSTTTRKRKAAEALATDGIDVSQNDANDASETTETNKKKPAANRRAPRGRRSVK